MYSSAGKRSPGRLSRQGPAVLRWCVYEAGNTHARAGAPDHACYAAAKDRIDGKRAALSEARKIIRQACHILSGLGDDRSARRDRRPASPARDAPAPGHGKRRRTHQMGHNRGQFPPCRCQPPGLQRRATRTASRD